MRNAQELYDFIKALLKERGILQTKMLNDLGLDDSFLSGTKKGSMPRSNYLAMIAVYLGVTTDYLLGLTDDPQKKELLSDERAILAMREIFILNGTLKPGERLTERQLNVIIDLIRNNADMLRELVDKHK